MSKLEKLGVIEVASETVGGGDPRYLKVKTEPSEHEVVQLNHDTGKPGKGVVGKIWHHGPCDVTGLGATRALRLCSSISMAMGLKNCSNC